MYKPALLQYPYQHNINVKTYYIPLSLAMKKIIFKLEKPKCII